jgi:hypothetical protein
MQASPATPPTALPPGDFLVVGVPWGSLILLAIVLGTLLAVAVLALVTARRRRDEP